MSGMSTLAKGLFLIYKPIVLQPYAFPFEGKVGAEG